MTAENITCTICLKELKIGDPNTLTTECNHSFHTNCFLKSLESKKRCPNCREKIKFKTKRRHLKTDTACRYVREIFENYDFFSKYDQAISFNEPDIIISQVLSLGLEVCKMVAQYYESKNISEEEEQESGNNLIHTRDIRFSQILNDEEFTDSDLDSISSSEHDSDSEDSDINLTSIENTSSEEFSANTQDEIKKDLDDKKVLFKVKEKSH